MFKTATTRLWLVTAAVCFICEDDIYKNCQKRTEMGQCEVKFNINAEMQKLLIYLQGKTIANTVDLYSKTTQEEVTSTIKEKNMNYRFRVNFSSLQHQTVQSMLSMCRRSCRVRVLENFPTFCCSPPPSVIFFTLLFLWVP